MLASPLVVVESPSAMQALTRRAVSSGPAVMPHTAGSNSTASSKPRPRTPMIDGVHRASSPIRSMIRFSSSAARSTSRSRSMILMVVKAASRGERIFFMGVVAKVEFRRHIEARVGDHGRNRQNAASKALAQNHCIRHRTDMLEGKETSCLAEARRNLVEDQQRAVLVAQATYFLPKSLRRNMAVRADWLGDDGGNASVRSRKCIAHLFKHTFGSTV